MRQKENRYLYCVAGTKLFHTHIYLLFVRMAFLAIRFCESIYTCNTPNDREKERVENFGLAGAIVVDGLMVVKMPHYVNDTYCRLLRKTKSFRIIRRNNDEIRVSTWQLLPMNEHNERINITIFSFQRHRHTDWIYGNGNCNNHLYKMEMAAIEHQDSEIDTCIEQQYSHKYVCIMYIHLTI